MIIFWMCWISDSNGMNCFSLIKPMFLEIKSWVSNSKQDPNAIPKKLLSSLFDFLPHPSAILEGIETEHLLICEKFRIALL